MNWFAQAKFAFYYILFGIVIGFLVLFFMPNSKMPFNWQSAKMAWHFIQHQQNINPAQTKITPHIENISFSEAVKKASPSVVSVNAFRPKGIRDSDRLGENERILDYGVGFGSGVILDPNGYIVTNYHVVANAEQISVNLPDGRKRFAELIGFDQPTDLAVLKTDLQGLQAADLASQGETQTGDLVMAIGSPFGQNQSVSLGIVSAITYTGFEPRIQTDAAINSGNSGGALINTRGEVIGINHSKLNLGRSLAQTGVNFAIPVEMVREIVASIITHGRVRRNWSGFEGRMLQQSEHERYFPNIPFGSGFFVMSVSPESPASEAGLMADDFITHLDGQPIADIRSFYRLYSKLPIGKKITLTILRRGKPLDLTLQLRERASA